jgi:hypothetical protein
MSQRRYKILVDAVSRMSDNARGFLARNPADFDAQGCQQAYIVANTLLDQSSFSPDKIKDPMDGSVIYGTDADASMFLNARAIGQNLQTKISAVCLAKKGTLSAAPKRRTVRRRRKTVRRRR